jgi:hypothetical protein
MTQYQLLKAKTILPGEDCFSLMTLLPIVHCKFTHQFSIILLIALCLVMNSLE